MLMRDWPSEAREIIEENRQIIREKTSTLIDIITYQDSPDSLTLEQLRGKYFSLRARVNLNFLKSIRILSGYLEDKSLSEETRKRVKTDVEWLQKSYISEVKNLGSLN
jgi:hypothetical protein